MTGAVIEPESPGLDMGPSPDDELRAGTFRLLGRLLAGPPDRSLLDLLSANVSDQAGATGDGIARAWSSLGVAARKCEIESVNAEYHELFIGVGRGELVPYGSWYLTGFLMERPLGELRRDLAALGLERDEKVREPEDHIAALFEVMALLITDAAYPVETERRFHRQHIVAWAGRFFEDLEKAKTACFYRSVGRLGSEFMALERNCLTMLA